MNLKKAFHHEEHEGHEDFPWGCMPYGANTSRLREQVVVPEVAQNGVMAVNGNVVDALENLLFFFVFFVPFVVKPPFNNERRRNETEQTG